MFVWYNHRHNIVIIKIIILIGLLNWTVAQNTPDLVYYQSYTYEVIKMMIIKWLMVRITRILEIFSSLLKIVEDKEAFRTYHIMIVVQLYFEEAFISVKIVRTNMITDKNHFSFWKNTSITGKYALSSHNWGW